MTREESDMEMAVRICGPKTRTFSGGEIQIFATAEQFDEFVRQVVAKHVGRVAISGAPDHADPADNEASALEWISLTIKLGESKGKYGYVEQEVIAEFNTGRITLKAVHLTKQRAQCAPVLTSNEGKQFMDIGSMIAIGLPIGLFVVAFYARPVGVVERAHLVHSAEDSVGALKLVDEVVSKKYLSFWEYECLLKIVKQSVFHEQSHAILADSKARAAIRRASKS